MHTRINSPLFQLHLESQCGVGLINLPFLSYCFHLPTCLARPDILHRKANPSAEILGPIPLDMKGGQFSVQLIAQLVNRTGYIERVL